MNPVFTVQDGIGHLFLEPDYIRKKSILAITAYGLMQDLRSLKPKATFCSESGLNLQVQISDNGALRHFKGACRKRRIFLN